MCGNVERVADEITVLRDLIKRQAEQRSLCIVNRGLAPFIVALNKRLVVMNLDCVIALAGMGMEVGSCMLDNHAVDSMNWFRNHSAVNSMT